MYFFSLHRVFISHNWLERFEILGENVWRLSAAVDLDLVDDTHNGNVVLFEGYQEQAFADIKHKAPAHPEDRGRINI